MLPTLSSKGSKPVRQTPNKDECPRRRKRKVRSFSRCGLNFSNTCFYNTIYSTSLGLINMQIYAYICAYSSRAKLRDCATFRGVNSQRTQPVNWWKWKLRDGGFHEVTALSPGSKEANRSEFPPMSLSGFLRFFFRNVSAFGSFLVPRTAFRLLFSQTKKRKVCKPTLTSRDVSKCSQSFSQKLQMSLSFFVLQLFKSQGLGSGGRNMFFKQHGLNKKPALSLFFPPFCFLSHLVSVYWFSYHTVRKPVRQTPNKDECPRRRKRKARSFFRCGLNF